MGLLLNRDCGSGVCWLNESLRLLLDGDLSAADLDAQRVWLPVTSEMDRTAVLALMLDLEPLVKATVDAKGRQLNDCRTNFVAGSDVLIEDGEGHVVSDVLDIDVKRL